MKSRAVLIYFHVFCAAFVYLYVRNKAALSDDTVFFGVGDGWAYQVLAVNIRYGRGYQDRGVEPFETYRFNERAKKRSDIDRYKPDGSRVTYYESFINRNPYTIDKPPGYPLFLAFVYRIFDVHPRMVKIFQVILLAMVAAVMPWIAAHYWGKWGIASGIASSFAFLHYFCPPPVNIQAESLSTFALTGWVVAFILWEKQPKLLRIFVLGTVSGVLLLIKGLNIFIPFFFILQLGIRKPRQRLLPVSVFFLAMACLILPWSVYASSKNGRLVLISTQGGPVLFEGNNEDSLKDGCRHTEWRRAKAGDHTYLYNRLKNTGYSPLKKVFIFYSQNINDLPKFFLYKLLQGFPVHKSIPFFLIMVGMFLYYLVRLFRSDGERVPIFPVIFFLNLLLITLIFFGEVRYSLPFLPFFVLPSVYFSFLLAKHFYSIRAHVK
ncbi:glycosyltransferase family 39 protein [bacterium]|nr:glycosyltransferase family 39 protein [bacterium]MCI0604246.1 glycosyltransferase family 39 protein [bacterium]